ncbi:MAG: T9SS type A sorting domain-containing protein [Saprospiraceae bacterium]|nr:T9SS type A sorting domain-containing protein [Saprospiraceae bacterium]
MSIKEQAQMTEMFAKAGEDHSYITNRGDKIYIPIKFHLVGDNNGKGRVKNSSILNQLDKLNADYAKHNFVFYLKDNYNFNHINSTPAYNTPRENEDFLNTKKDPNAVNVFVVNTIGESSAGIGIVLGYYSPSNDFVVLMAGEAANATNTLSHELGHFFNLRHTFYGWEASPYDEDEHGNPCVINIIPGTNIQVEKVDRSNCNVAADLLCDTPPDYNFGITQTNCVFGKIILDKNLDTIIPMKDNQMSYFSQCASYQFTDNQETRMRTNYNNSLRAYIRSSYIPVTDTLSETSVLVTPTVGSKEEVYNNVYFEWENQDASYYLLEIVNSNEYHYFFLTENFKEVTTLLPNKLYVWSVRAFHDGYTGTTSPQVNFRTGNIQTATDEIKEIESISLFPNPVRNGNRPMLKIMSKTSEAYKIDITDLNGRRLYSTLQSVQAGENNISLNTAGITTGVYAVSLSNSEGILTNMLSIQ